MSKATAAEITAGMANFYGTETWHRWSILFPKMLLTDGAKYLAEKAGAFWLMDAIASHQPKALKDRMLRDMQFWTLKVNADKTAVLTCERDSGNVAITQKIEYTDFPLPEIKLYVGPMGDGQYTILLPSEY